MRIRPDAFLYLKIGGKKYKLPVNPETIKISYPTSNKTYYVLGKGEVVVPRKPSLRTVSWESFFPTGNEPYVNNGAKGPRSYEKAIRNAMTNKKICRLIISRGELYDTNMTCVISKFDTTDKGGEPGDMYYSIELTEYKGYSPSLVTILQPPVPAAQATTTATAPATETKQRPVETPTLRVGASVVVNGKYWYTSQGAKPFGNANNLSGTVQRIVNGAPYPIAISGRGWVQESQIQVVG